MADWNLPTLSSTYASFLSLMKDRDFDTGSLFLNAPTNPVTGMIRYVRASNKFQEYDGAVWVDKVLSVVGGGTGGATAGDARTNLGIGTMGIQNANSVNITGGAIAGLSSFQVAGSIVAGGQLTLGSTPVVLTNAAGKIFALTTDYLASLNASALTALNASALASGTVHVDRMGSGATGTKFLRGDNTWADAMAYRAIEQIDTVINIDGAHSVGQTYDIGLSAFTTVGKLFFITTQSLKFVSAAGTVTYDISVSFPSAAIMRFTLRARDGAPGAVRINGTVLEIM